MQQFDLLIIGSGLSGMISLKQTLIDLQLYKLSTPLKIAVIEQQEELWNGVAFGSKSSANSLTINQVSEFIYNNSERLSFTNWLTANKEEIITTYLRKGGNAAQQWVKQHQLFIEAGQWNSLYIPRYWYKQYLAESLAMLIKKASALNLIELTTIKGEATGAESNFGQYTITVQTSTHHQQKIAAEKLLLAIGSPPVKSLPQVTNHQAFTYINDLYAGSVNTALEAIRRKLTTIAEADERNILIVGSNASCTELLYLLNHDVQLNKLINQIVVLSPSGALPLVANNHSVVQGHFNHLHLLSEQRIFTYTELIDATLIDLRIANKNGVNIEIVQLLVNQALQLKLRLTDDEQELFQVAFGPAISGNIRRMGGNYRNAITCLSKTNKLKILKGTFNSLQTQTNCNNAVLTYTDENGRLTTYSSTFSATINCTGFENLHQCSSKLINSLIDGQLCRVNSSGRGFTVSESFEANEQLYIMGPLLAGNNNKNVHFWHLENVSRILQLSPIMTQYMLKDYQHSVNEKQLTIA